MEQKVGQRSLNTEKIGKRQKEGKRIDLQLKRKEREANIAGDISATSDMKYLQDSENKKKQRETRDPETMKQTETPSPPPQTTWKKRWQHMSLAHIPQYPPKTIYVSEKSKRNKQQENNVRSAELNSMETLIKKAAANPDLFEIICCFKEINISQILNDYNTLAEKLIHSWGIIMADNQIIVPKTLQYAAPNALHSDTPKSTKCVATQLYSGDRTFGKTWRRSQRLAQVASTPLRL